MWLNLIRKFFVQLQQIWSWLLLTADQHWQRAPSNSYLKLLEGLRPASRKAYLKGLAEFDRWLIRTRRSVVTITQLDHALWDYLLKSYVENGLVDYDGISRDHSFRIYLRQLSEAESEKLTTSVDQLALLCNAYNAFVINGVI